MNCECGIQVEFPTQCANIDLNYCGVEIPVSNVVFVNELPPIGDKDQLYICGMSIYRWNNDTLKFVCIAGENFIEEYFTDPMKVIIFDGGDADVTLAILDDTVLL